MSYDSFVKFYGTNLKFKESLYNKSRCLLELNVKYLMLFSMCVCDASNSNRQYRTNTNDLAY